MKQLRIDLKLTRFQPGNEKSALVYVEAEAALANLPTVYHLMWLSQAEAPILQRYVKGDKLRLTLSSSPLWRDSLRVVAEVHCRVATDNTTISVYNTLYSAIKEFGVLGCWLNISVNIPVNS